MKKFNTLFLGILMTLLTINVHAAGSQQEPEPFSDGELEQVLAPIALYPDSVLSHILIAATYPLEVIQAERWVNNNPDLSGSDSVEAVEEKQWDPSVKALVAFPQVLQRLSQNLDWTQKLGDAFLQDEKRVLASVQSLRQRAYDSGNLDKMDKVSVTREDNSIVIESREKEIVYVPYYDTRVVYGPWYWSHYPPVYWEHSYYSHRSGPFYWGPSVHVGYGFFFSSFHWHDHYIVRIPRHNYHPNRYYSHRQIVHHEHARRWQHNPTHRHGVSYRSVTVRDRYQSNRASREEINRTRNDRRDTRANTDRRTNREDGQIPNPNRIRNELRDGRLPAAAGNSQSRGEDSNTNRNRSNNRANADRQNPGQANRETRNNDNQPPKKDQRQQSDGNSSRPATNSNKEAESNRRQQREANQRGKDNSSSSNRSRDSSRSNRSSNRNSERSRSKSRSSDNRSSKRKDN